MLSKAGILSALSTSELPLALEMARLPCLATFTPSAPSINAVVVETLILLKPSPPVPTMSIISLSSLKVCEYFKMLLTRADKERSSRDFSVISTSKAPSCTASYSRLAMIWQIWAKSSVFKP